MNQEGLHESALDIWKKSHAEVMESSPWEPRSHGLVLLLHFIYISMGLYVPHLPSEHSTLI